MLATTPESTAGRQTGGQFLIWELIELVCTAFLRKLSVFQNFPGVGYEVPSLGAGTSFLNPCVLPSEHFGTDRFRLIRISRYVVQ